MWAREGEDQNQGPGVDLGASGPAYRTQAVLHATTVCREVKFLERPADDPESFCALQHDIHRLVTE